MEGTLYINEILEESIVDGPGMRYTIFVQGCPHNCKGCHNPQTHAFNSGKEVMISKIIEEVEENPLLEGVTFSGGEPFCQASVLAILGKVIHALHKNVVTYTGYTYEQLCEMAKNDCSIQSLLDETDWLVDGPFIIEERDLTLTYRGSRNQRIIDLQMMREKSNTDHILLWEEAE